MQISAKKVKQARIVEEKVIGSVESIISVTDIAVEGLTLDKLSGIESKCAELQVDFIEGDDLFVISKAKYTNDRIELDDVMYVVKEVALEDFIARLIKNSTEV